MKVPYTNNVVPGPGAQDQPMPPAPFLAMAAAVVHNQRLASMSDDLATWLTGRDAGQRVFYNQTRAGLLNPNTPPDTASPMGGLGISLKDRREMQGYEAQDIEDKFFGQRR